MKLFFGEFMYDHEDISEEVDFSGWEAVETRLEEASCDFLQNLKDTGGNPADYKMIVTYSFEPLSN